jgi:hypothetical protein
MNGHKGLLRLLIITQAYLLFAVIFMPALVRSMDQFYGKLVYGIFAALCILLTLLLRRALTDLE